MTIPQVYMASMTEIEKQKAASYRMFEAVAAANAEKKEDQDRFLASKQPR